MFINNLDTMIKIGKIHKDNYYICGFIKSLILSMNGFQPISEKDGKYFYLKTDVLMRFLKRRGELEVEEEYKENGGEHLIE